MQRADHRGRAPEALRGCGRALRPHDHPDGRDGQVRGERLPRAEGLLRQRDRRCVRRAGRGGACLPKDLRALLHAARVADVTLPVLSSILPSNEAQVRRGVEAVLATRRPRIGVVGLAFKAGTDDLRESPMVTLVETLIGKGCDVRILDRNVAMARLLGANRRYIEEEIPHIASLMCSGVEALLAHAQVLVIGSGGEDAAETLAAASDAHLVVDLTRGAVRRDRG